MTTRELTNKMRSKVKYFFLHFLIYFTLLIPYSINIISIDFFSRKEVASIDSEFKVKEHKTQDFIFSESSDDVEETRPTSLIHFYIYDREENFALALSKRFIPFQKIPYKLLSIPPPQIV